MQDQNSRLADFLKSLSKDVYDEIDSEGNKTIMRDIIPQLVKEIPAKMPCVLDVGYGTGFAQELFNSLNCLTQSITLNPVEQKEGEKRKHLAAICDQNNLRAGVETYSLVFARHVLEHSPIPLWTLHEYKRVLKSGGLLYVEVPAPDTVCHHETNQNHYSVLTPGMWMALFDKAGFKILWGRKIEIQTQLGPDFYFQFLCKKPDSTTRDNPAKATDGERVIPTSEKS